MRALGSSPPETLMFRTSMADMDESLIEDMKA
jgi:hypothetical protein